MLPRGAVAMAARRPRRSTVESGSGHATLNLCPMRVPLRAAPLQLAATVKVSVSMLAHHVRRPPSWRATTKLRCESRLETFLAAHSNGRVCGEPALNKVGVAKGGMAAGARWSIHDATPQHGVSVPYACLQRCSARPGRVQVAVPPFNRQP